MKRSASPLRRRAKGLLLATICVASALVASACGSSDDANTTPPASATTGADGGSSSGSSGGSLGDSGASIDAGLPSRPIEPGWNAPFALDPAAEGLSTSFEWDYSNTTATTPLSTTVLASNASNPSAPVSGPGVGRASYAAGALESGNDEVTWAYASGRARRIYLRQMVWLSPTYAVHTKGEYFLNLGLVDEATNKTLGQSLFTFELSSSAGSAAETQSLPIRFRFWPLSVSGGIEQKAGPFLARGKWHQLELFVRMRSVGNSDGEVRVWIDGALAFEQTGLPFVGQDPAWSRLAWSAYRGPGTSAYPVPPEAQSRDYDHLQLFSSPTR